jgi:hypothetical protein
MKKNNLMNICEWTGNHSTLLNTISIVTFSCVLVLLTSAIAFAQYKTVFPHDQKGFATPEEAAVAIADASEKYDEAALKEILGPDSFDIVHSGDPTNDRQVATDFAALAKTKTKIVYDPRNRTRASLNVGADDWPFAIPLAKVGGKWYFDTPAGRQELMYRRVGRNELDAITVCRGFVDAQNQYASEKHDGAMVTQYAQKIISTPGKHDGLAWQDADGTWGGSVGDRAAKELQAAYTGQRVPFHGYYFKVLKGQGPAAPIGAIDYVINGAMIGGFALLAYPATYGFTGVKSFMVSQDGVVWERDLGQGTVPAAEAIDLFNPDHTWTPVLENY